MHKNGTVAWVDVFEKRFFEGRLVRLRADGAEKSAIYAGNALPHFASMIVGPGAAVELAPHGDAKRVHVQQRTILADTSDLINGHRLQFLRVTGSRRPARKVRR